MTIDPRLVERRRVVAENRARQRISRLLKVMAAIAVIGAVVWLALSPVLSVQEVRSAGIIQSETHRALASEGVRAGTPMVLLRPSQIERVLEEDPWVAKATVELDWPGTVIVRVEERTAVAWVETRSGWARRALDGMALPSSSVPDSSLGWIRLPDVIEVDGVAALEVLGSVEFVAALPESLAAQVRLSKEENGEIWADVAGFRVRLGRPVEMTAKALSLTALLRESPDPGSILTLIAPSYPAVTPVSLPRLPQGEVESGDSDQP